MEMVDRLGDRKSEATIPRNENRKPNQMIKDRRMKARLIGLDCRS